MKAAFEKRSLDPQEEHFTKLRDVNITTVDSFQVSRISKKLVKKDKIIEKYANFGPAHNRARFNEKFYVIFWSQFAALFNFNFISLAHMINT